MESNNIESNPIMLDTPPPPEDAPGVYLRPAGARSETRRFLGLVRALSARELRARYRRSLLGPAWAVLQPLCYMLLFVFIRRLLNIGRGDGSDVIFIYSALVPWTFFSNAVVRCGPSVQTSAGVVKKIALRREVFPVSGVVVSLADLLIASALLVAMMLYYRTPMSWEILWVLPLTLLAAVAALGVGLGVAAVGTYKRDIILATPFLMQFWLLATPILYGLDRIPAKWRFVYALNPMVGVVDGFRNALLHAQAPDGALVLAGLIGTAVVWAVAWPLFRKLSQYFADVL